MTLKLDDSRRSDLIAGLQDFFFQQFEEELSAFRAEQILEFLLGTLGAQVYNQAVQDAGSSCRRNSTTWMARCMFPRLPGRSSDTVFAGVEGAALFLFHRRRPIA
jgi:uncharacterized protein (DUF2164 family)